MNKFILKNEGNKLKFGVKPGEFKEIDKTQIAKRNVFLENGFAEIPDLEEIDFKNEIKKQFLDDQNKVIEVTEDLFDNNI